MEGIQHSEVAEANTLSFILAKGGIFSFTVISSTFIVEGRNPGIGLICLPVAALINRRKLRQGLSGIARGATFLLLFSAKQESKNHT